MFDDANQEPSKVNTNDVGIEDLSQQASQVTSAASTTVEGGTDYSVAFVVNGPAEGKLLQLTVATTCQQAGESGYFYLDVFVQVIDAPAA